MGRIVQRSELNAFFDPPDHILVNFNTVLEGLSAVNHTMANSDNFEVAHLAQQSHRECRYAWL